MTTFVGHVRRILGVLGAVVALSTIHTATAHAAKAIDARSGMHRGKLVIPYLHRYHVRIGPKTGHPAASHRCFGGVYHKKPSANVFPMDAWWSPFDLRDWNWHGIVDVSTQAGVTAATCAVFGAAVLGELPSEGFRHAHHARFCRGL
jgi:hypothetical protein